MQSSLGIYIEKDIIKYAKLQKDKDDIKVESYNIAFYDNDIDEVIKRIISETYSYKTPISINVSDEIYSIFEISSLLSKNDTKKAIDIEFEMLCSEQGYNKVSVEHKYLIVEEKENQDKQKILSITANKNEIAKTVNHFTGNKVATIAPISTSITNLVNIEERENVAILNIENKTKLTTIIDGQIYQIDAFDEGMGMIIDEINKIENSISKSYETCKNMTLYTQNASELYGENSQYMDIVTSVLAVIADKTKEVLGQFFSGIDKIYITGLATSLNNIDLFMQDLIPSSKCEILKPYFMQNLEGSVSIKEYIEVNSAIALALDGLGMIRKDVNFSKAGKSVGSKPGVKLDLKKDISLADIKNAFVNLGSRFREDFASPLTSVEKVLLRGSIALVVTIIMYVIFSSSISSSIEKKSAEVAEANQKISSELAKIDSDKSVIQGRTAVYENLIEELTAVDEEDDTEVATKERVIKKNSIPNLLNQVMFVIPKKVKLTSIQNTTEDHIVIKAESEKYEQLGYFKAALTTGLILENVKSTSGVKNGSVVEVTIEGDLP